GGGGKGFLRGLGGLRVITNSKANCAWLERTIAQNDPFVKSIKFVKQYRPVCSRAKPWSRGSQTPSHDLLGNGSALASSWPLTFPTRADIRPWR
ncbi:MAG: hypothetical protein V3V55_08185, partial [Rhodospirillales bacterium]